VFKKGEVLMKLLRQERANKIIKEFQNKLAGLSSLNKLLRKIDQTGA